MPVSFAVEEIKIPIAASISTIPVIHIIAFFAGIFGGNIITMPLVNLKCPNDVNSNITANAILPLSGTFTPEMIAVVPRLIKKNNNNTNSGFILIQFLLLLIALN